MNIRKKHVIKASASKDDVYFVVLDSAGNVVSTSVVDESIADKTAKQLRSGGRKVKKFTSYEAYCDFLDSANEERKNQSRMSKKSVGASTKRKRTVKAAKIEDWGDGPVKVFWKSGKWSIIMDGYGLGITDGWGVERPIIYTHKNPPTVAYDGTAISVPPYVKRKFEELVQKGVLKNRSDLYDSGEWDTYFESSTSTKRKRTIKAAASKNDLTRKLSKLYNDYMAIDDDRALKKTGMTLAEYNALPDVFERLQKNGHVNTFMTGLANYFKKFGFSVSLDGTDYEITASSSTKRRFSVKASTDKSKTIEVHFNDGRKPAKYTASVLEDMMTESNVDYIIDAETGELIYESEHGDVRSAIKASALDDARDNREELSGTYYIVYNGDIIVETDGTGDAGEDALAEVFTMDADALAAAVEYLNSFGDDLIEEDEISDAGEVARVLSQFIQMEYDEGQMDPTYFGSEIYWDGGRIEWFDAADLAESNNVDEWIENTDLSAEDLDLDIDSAQSVECAYDPTDENAKYDATFSVESYYGYNNDPFRGLEDVMYTDDWSEVEEWSHSHLMRGGNIRIDSKYGILEVTADEYNEAWENGAADFDINEDIVRFKEKIVKGSQSVKCSESIMAYAGDEVDTDEIKEALRNAGVREWGVERYSHHGKNGFENAYRICVDDVTGDFEAVVNALEAAGFSAKFLESFGNWLVFSISDTREEPKYCYRVSYDYTSDIVPMDDSTTDYQSIIDALIDQMESEGNTGYLYTLDEVEEEGWNEDEYVIGGNHGLALYHGGNLHIEDLGMMKPSEAVNSSTSIQAERTTLRDRDITSADDVRELVLYITNDGDLYRQRTTPIIENLKRKVKKGNYDRELAVKAWQYLADDGVRKYDKEFGSGRGSLTLLDKATREEIARELRDYYEEQVMWDANHPESSDDLTTV